MGRPLTPRQRQALQMVSLEFVTRHTRGSIPSLARRGLVVVEKRGGRLTGRYLLTDAGREAVAAGVAPPT